MKLREMAVAVAALSLAGAAMAAGNDTSSTTTNRVPSARQGQSLDQSTQAQQGQAAMGNAAGTSGSTPKMGGSPSSQMGNSASSSSQNGSMASEEHNPQLVREAQQALKQKGFDAGAADGHMGPNTENAIKQFQQAQGIPQSGNLDQQTLSALGVNENQMGSSSQGNTSGAQSGTSSGSTSMGASHGSQQGSSKTSNSAYK
jgi:peptidoglycan hydrolase-like protein with peptidoglycan-binding domain